MAIRRSHWNIENKLYWSLDMTFREDESRVRQGHGDENLNVLRHLALNIVKKDTTLKGSMRLKLKYCDLDHTYLVDLLQLSPSLG